MREKVVGVPYMSSLLLNELVYDMKFAVSALDEGEGEYSRLFDAAIQDFRSPLLAGHSLGNDTRYITRYSHSVILHKMLASAFESHHERKNQPAYANPAEDVALCESTARGAAFRGRC